MLSDDCRNFLMYPESFRAPLEKKLYQRTQEASRIVRHASRFGLPGRPAGRRVHRHGMKDFWQIRHKFIIAHGPYMRVQKMG